MKKRRLVEDAMGTDDDGEGVVVVVVAVVEPEAERKEGMDIGGGGGEGEHDGAGAGAGADRGSLDGPATLCCASCEDPALRRRHASVALERKPL